MSDQNDKLSELIQPSFQVLFEAYITSSAIKHHYVRTMSELTGKPTVQIEEELQKLSLEAKDELLRKIPHVNVQETGPTPPPRKDSTPPAPGSANADEK